MSALGLNSSASIARYGQTQQPRDTVVCDEILTTVNNFKTFLAEQKKIREELSNLSQQPLVKLKDELAIMMQQVSTVTLGLRRISAQRDRLKEDMLKEEKNVRMAQRTSEMSVSMQLENTAPTEYFLNKLMEFDMRMRSYKQELEILEENISCQTRFCLSPRDLIALLRQMDSEFICLAAQLQTVSEEVKTLKTKYLRNFRASSGDNRNPFAEVEASSQKMRQLEGSLDGIPLGFKTSMATSRTPYGPSPFSSTSLTPALGLSSITAQAAPTVGAPRPAGPFSFVNSGSLSGSLGATATTAQPIGSQLSSGFNFNAATSASPGLVSAAPGFGQKPLFGFGAATTTTTSTAGGLSLFGQPAATTPQLLTAATTTSGPVTGFGTANAAGDGLFGKRFASKPASLFLPKT
ncbi:unnamed protein product [Calicophoron daubneyi]|uniref:Uncharacterized protein n=1 Tax=Calicophoron daubneyi TaxID=300641 RepID=A0AAV2TNM2_CALDB